MMNYNSINCCLLRKYKKYIINEIENLRCKNIGEYFSGTKFTTEDNERYNNLCKKLQIIQKRLY